jgi:hypothetical protein
VLEQNRRCWNRTEGAGTERKVLEQNGEVNKRRTQQKNTSKYNHRYI